MRNSRPYVQIDPDVLERARQIDLFSYLRAYAENRGVVMGMLRKLQQQGKTIVTVTMMTM